MGLEEKEDAFSIVRSPWPSFLLCGLFVRSWKESGDRSRYNVIPSKKACWAFKSRTGLRESHNTNKQTISAQCGFSFGALFTFRKKLYYEWLECPLSNGLPNLIFFVPQHVKIQKFVSIFLIFFRFWFDCLKILFSSFHSERLGQKKEKVRTSFDTAQTPSGQFLKYE